MRKAFAEALYKEMETDPTIYLITADLGYGLFDKIREHFPNRFFNVQAAEMAAMGVAIGISLEGKKALFYSITPFLLNRPYEMIKLYLEGEGVPVKLIGSGRGQDYSHDGPSHWETEYGFTFPKVLPENYANLEVCLHHVLNNNKPTFLSLKR
jgi:transketolase